MVLRRRRSTAFIGALALGQLRTALASGADIVCIDLEDAVPPHRKDEARTEAVAAISRAKVPKLVQLVARVNRITTEEGARDALSLLCKPAVGALVLPKIDSAADVLRAAAFADGAHSEAELYAIIETPEGLENCPAIARSHPRLKALFFGAFDLSTALGCANEWEPLLYARSRTVLAAAGAGIDAIDAPFAATDDLEGLRTACRQVKALGMTGKAAKHVSHIAVINECFTPSEAEIRLAREIVAKFRAHPERPILHDGKLVELPVIKRLERLAALGDH